MKPDPDLMVAGLKLWVRSREFETSEDYWDGNWLSVEALCEAEGCRLFASGPFVHLSEIEAFLEGCRALDDTLRGAARLEGTFSETILVPTL